VKAQIEQGVGAIRRRGLLGRGQGSNPGKHRCGQPLPRHAPAAWPPDDEIQKAMIQVAHRRLNFGRHMRPSQPSSDVCILHNRLANRRPDTKIPETSRIPAQTRRRASFKPLGKYANFVINFCQILF